MIDISTYDFGFTPSEYQNKIFNFILHGQGNAFVKARAGSAKTTTMVAAMKLINPKNNVLFLAFNKSIAEELDSKLVDYKNIDVKTSHSLGFSIIRKNVSHEIEVDEYKYRTYIKSHLEEISSVDDSLTRSQLHSYIDNISSLVDFARFNMAQSVDEVKALTVKYNILPIADECEAVVKVLEWGKTMLDIVDFTDMIWLPVELSMNPYNLKYNYICVDEAQDQSIVMIELFQKCIKRGGRFIFVGDDFQCINGFAGSSEEAFDALSNFPKTTIFELPICYRCPTSVIELVHNFVSDIQPKENASMGEVVSNCFTHSLKGGDMILCRTKAPLFRAYVKLLRNGIPCYIKGQEIGNNLKNVLENIDIEELNLSLKEDGVFVRLYDNLFSMRNKVMNDCGLDCHDATLSSYVMNMYDTIATLSVLSEKLQTKTELIKHIDTIFSETEDGVVLSTIHKAKGLESDNVYILCNSSMPSSLAKKDWEKQQELNLIYVAYTRAKKKLGFISEEEIKPFGLSQSDDNILKELGLIENIVCRILGKQPIEITESVDVARFNLRNGITKIEPIVIKENHKVLNKPQRIKHPDLLSELDELL